MRFLGTIEKYTWNNSPGSTPLHDPLRYDEEKS